MEKSLKKEMNRAIFFKEWIKLKWPTVICGTVLLCAIAYIFIEINHSHRTLGAISLWDMIVHKDYRMINTFMHLPILAGLGIGIAQFVPEMQKKRLKLTLHLPMNENKIILRMLNIGLSILFLLFSTSTIVLVGGLRWIFAPEIACAWTKALLPWLASGFASYLLIAWIAIEPTWKQRIFNALVAVPLVGVFVMGGSSFAYTYFTPFLYLVCIALLVLVYRSVLRFKEGVQ